MAQGRNRRRVDRVPQALGGGARRSRVGLPLAAAGGLALLLAAGLGSWRLLTTSDALRIGAVRFTGLSRIAAAELEALSPLKPGENLLLADLSALERALGRHPWVKSAEARRAFPPAVEVRVAEREPAALVDLGGLYLVDGQGRVFKRASPGDGLDLPVITGFTRDDYLQRRPDLERLLVGALALLDGYARQGLEAFGPVAEVHVDGDEGVTLYLGEDGTQVRLGAGEMPQKLERLRAVLQALGAEGRRAEALYLDNRNRPTWVTVRLAREERDAGRSAPPTLRPATGRARESPLERRGRAAPLARR